MISYPNRQMLHGFLENIDYMLESIRCYSQDPIHYTDLTGDQWDLLYHLRRHLKQAEDQAEQLIRSVEMDEAVKADVISHFRDGESHAKSCCNCEYFDMNTKTCELHPEKEAWSMDAHKCDDYYYLDPSKGSGIVF